MTTGPYQERRAPSGRFLPPDPRVREPHRLTPQLALRVAILGAVALAVFGVLFLRLWSLQVLSGDDYLNAAQSNQLRLVRVEAPRGPLLDRHGRVVVSNVAGTAVELWVGDMPKEGRYELVQRLARVLDVSPRALARQVEERRFDPLTPIVVKTAVGEEQVDYVYEHQAEFPGVEIVQIYLRDYPYSALAAQILGYTGEISPEELKRLRKDGYRSGDRIGKTGIEAAYDSYLRGRAGLGEIRVDSLGRPVSPYVPRQEPRSGYAIRLTLDMRLQRAAEQALQYGIDLAHAERPLGGERRRDRRARPAGTAPSSRWRRLRRTSRRCSSAVRIRRSSRRSTPISSNPLFNRATAGLYPPGSTWKPVTALAGMQEHVFSAYESIQCTPSATYGLDKQRFRNWNPFVNRPMTLPEALAESCDTYFYEIGNRFYEGGSDSRVRMQQWARKFGFGAPTGLDIGGEADGLVPTPEWREKTFESDWDRAWNPGDSIQLAIGQKDLLVTPLQMACVLRDARERREGRHAASRLGRRAARSERARRESSCDASLRPRRRRPGSIPRHWRRSATACTSRRTPRRARPRACSRATRCRSPGRRGRRRRSCRFPAIRSTISRISRGGVVGGRRTPRGSSSARSSRTAATARLRRRRQR